MTNARRPAYQIALHQLIQRAAAKRALRSLAQAALPPRPETVRQNETRRFVSKLGWVWRQTMTPVQQNSFLLLGQQMPDKKGRPMAPFQAFVKVHCLRRAAGWLEVLTIAPSSATFPMGATCPVGGVPQGGGKKEITCPVGGNSSARPPLNVPGPVTGVTLAAERVLTPQPPSLVRSQSLAGKGEADTLYPFPLREAPHTQACGAGSRAGGRNSFSLTLSCDPAPDGARIQIQACAPVLWGRTRFRDKEFSTFPTGGVPLRGEEQIGPAFAAQFGVPQVGMKVVVRVRVINAAGCAGGWTLAEAVVQAAPSPVEEPPFLLHPVPPEGEIQSKHRAQLPSDTPLQVAGGAEPRAP